MIADMMNSRTTTVKKKEWLIAEFAGNVAWIRSSTGEIQETADKESAVQTITNWIHKGVLKKDAMPDIEKKTPRGVAKSLEINKVNDTIIITDSARQSIVCEDDAKAVNALRRWVLSGILR